MQFFKSILLVAILFGLASCASSALQIQSEPAGADIYIQTKSGALSKLGQTPLQISEAQAAPQGEGFQVTLSKDGFISQSITVPPSYLNRTTAISIRLKENIKNSNNDEALDRVASGVAHTQQLIRLKDFERATQTLTTLSSQYPGVSTFHELLGNVYYLQKDPSKALESYKKAAELNPRNMDTQNMIQKLSDYKKGPGL